MGDCDALIKPYLFSMDTSFEKGDAGLFAFGNTRIEAVDNGDDMNELQKLCGSKVVEVRYHVCSQ